MPLSEVAQIIGAKDTREGEVSGAASDREESSDNYYHELVLQGHISEFFSAICLRPPRHERARQRWLPSGLYTSYISLPLSVPPRQSERTNVTDPWLPWAERPPPG